MLSILLLITILGSFAFGIAAGYWVICGVLNYFDPARQVRRTASASPILVSTSSGD